MQTGKQIDIFVRSGPPLYIIPTAAAVTLTTACLPRIAWMLAVIAPSVVYDDYVAEADRPTDDDDSCMVYPWERVNSSQSVYPSHIHFPLAAVQNKLRY